ncbi:MAG: SAM-dependent methyltransferase [Marinilabiliales bacterium]|nr:MAG: SAM-dependent methyltransferase [Marinilabiliales bacterium]
MKIFWLISSYIQYLFKSKSRYVIHSPFVHQLIKEVFMDRGSNSDLKTLDDARKQMFQRTTAIETTDLGAGAGNKPYITLINPLGKIAKRRALDKKNLHLLYHLTRYFKPENILEFGTSAGISTSYIGKANDFKKFVTMEGCAVLASHAKNYFDSLNLSKIEIKVGNFDDILDKTLSGFEQLDMVFVDGNHRQHKTLDYFNKCLAKAHENSIFIFDDIHWSPEMEKAWEQIKKSERVHVSIDLYKMGILFFRKGISRQNFIIRY